jgi:hypothetical protein
MSKLGSVKEYAIHRGVSVEAVYHAIRAGKVLRGDEGLIDFEATDARWEATREGIGRGGDYRSPAARARRMELAGTPVSDTPTNLVDAKTKNEVIKAQIAELKLAELQGKVISKDLVSRVEFALGKGYRDILEQRAVHIAPKVAGKTDLREIEEILRSSIREILTDVADRIERKEFVADILDDFKQQQQLAEEEDDEDA